MTRKALMVGAALLGLVLAGCGGPAEDPPSDGQETTGQSTATQEPVTPPRTGPAKAAEIASKCSIVAESQWKSLGADEEPRERTSNGLAGCQYQKGKAGTAGWGVFVAVSGNASFDEEVGKRRDPNKIADLAGYPAAAYQESTGCVLYVNISDKGFLISNIAKTSTADPGVDMCQQAEKFAEAAIQNLPNA
ncbi:DUF3558 domain-containing protein [Saccharopolyspora sp. 5N102]|uniref:DUF3558 domain-containing protein n=1 Tax=Saccharopolyspora sp. 5N102 TaxID=3375155 RepID=UPI0037B5E1F1